ncbi:MAG: PilZ domain-containing protein [Deltaproteobacteria bacterium]
MPEKRSHQRITVSGTVTIKPEDSSGRIIKAGLVDVSYGGFSVYTQEDMAEGTAVLFDAATDCSGMKFNGKGKISRVTKIKRRGTTYFNIGIKFTEFEKYTVLGILSYKPPKSGSKKDTLADYGIPY